MAKVPGNLPDVETFLYRSPKPCIYMRQTEEQHREVVEAQIARFADAGKPPPWTGLAKWLRACGCEVDESHLKYHYRRVPHVCS